jgi:hypothetical protein
VRTPPLVLNGGGTLWPRWNVAPAPLASYTCPSTRPSRAPPPSLSGASRIVSPARRSRATRHGRRTAHVDVTPCAIAQRAPPRWGQQREPGGAGRSNDPRPPPAAERRRPPAHVTQARRWGWCGARHTTPQGGAAQGQNPSQTPARTCAASCVGAARYRACSRGGVAHARMGSAPA